MDGEMYMNIHEMDIIKQLNTEQFVSQRTAAGLCQFSLTDKLFGIQLFYDIHFMNVHIHFSIHIREHSIYYQISYLLSRIFVRISYGKTDDFSAVTGGYFGLEGTVFYIIFLCLAGGPADFKLNFSGPNRLFQNRRSTGPGWCITASERKLL